MLAEFLLLFARRCVIGMAPAVDGDACEFVVSQMTGEFGRPTAQG